MKFALFYHRESTVTIALSVETPITWCPQTCRRVQEAIESLELSVGVIVLKDASIVLTNNSDAAWRDILLPILEAIQDLVTPGEPLVLAWNPTSYGRYLNEADFQALPKAQLSPLAESG